jgi:hypothetical protein
VLESIVAGLARMGPAAREALPQLDRSIKAGPRVSGPEASPAEKAREAKLIRAMQGAAAKIRGK